MNNIYTDTPSGALQEEFNEFINNANDIINLYELNNNGKKLNYDNLYNVLLTFMNNFIEEIKEERTKEGENGGSK